MSVQIMVPALGESVSEATVLKWFKNVGEAVEVDEPLVELETDKVTVEVPAPSAGFLTEIVTMNKWRDQKGDAAYDMLKASTTFHHMMVG